MNVNDLYKHTCGHRLPSTENSALNFNMDRNLFSKRYTFDLKANDAALITSSTEMDNNRVKL